MEGTLQTQRYDQKTTLACDVHAEDLRVNEPASPKTPNLRDHFVILLSGFLHSAIAGSWVTFFIPFQRNLLN